MSDFFDEANSVKGTSGAERTIVSKETVICGNISSPCDIVVDGAVKGNIKSGSYVELTGRLEGDISAETALVSDGILKGNIKTEGEVTVVGNSTVVGDISCHSLELNAKIKGNITAAEFVLLKKGAVVQGNITAKNFTADDGTKLIGYLNIIRPDAENEDEVEDIDSLLMFEDLNEHYETPEKKEPSPVVAVAEKKSEEIKPKEVKAKPAKIIRAEVEETKTPEPTAPETKKESTPTTFGVALQSAVKQAERVKEESAAINEQTAEMTAIVEETSTAVVQTAEQEPVLATGTISLTEKDEQEPPTQGSGTGSFFSEKQNILQDLKKRLEKAKRTNATPEQP